MTLSQISYCSHSFFGLQPTVSLLIRAGIVSPHLQPSPRPRTGPRARVHDPSKSFAPLLVEAGYGQQSNFLNPMLPCRLVAT